MSSDESYFASDQFLRVINERLKKIDVDRLVSLPASRFSADDLTAAYNEIRSDYIIPMPMTSPQFEEYVEIHDLKLSASSAIMDTIMGRIIGMGLLGLRGQRAWISRFGIDKHFRESGIGQLIMESLLAAARQNGAKEVTLDLIEGDIFCLQLAHRVGFQATDKLLVGRRPPENTWFEPASTPSGVEVLQGDAVLPLLEARENTPDWRNELATFRHLKERLGAIKVDDVSQLGPHSGSGWVVFEDRRLQLNRITVEVVEGDPTGVTRSLLLLLHALYPKRDARIENLPVFDPRWSGFEAAGYFESFRRVQFELKL